ncbi:MAG: sodium transporter [Planctomycetes bacterium GWF2_41_51]|nr:MAG: sodium transporter [Planctomycetes bacterium GWF2_41_51]
MTASIILLLVFLLGMVVIGIWGMKKTATLNDFFLGGRSVGPWITAFAYGTSYFSAVVFIGFGGKIGWGYGLKGLAIAIGNAFIGTTAAWLILGRRARRMTQNLDAMTMPEFLQERFGSRYIKMFAALIIFVFLIPYSASVFKGLGYLFEKNFHIQFETALLIMVAITGLYLVLGGYFAVTLTDFVQGIIMIFGSILMVWILSGKAAEIAGTSGIGGGFTAATDSYNQWHSALPAGKEPSMLMLGALVFMTSFGVWGMPQMVQKFYAIKNEAVINKAALITTIFAVIISFAAYYTGALTHIFYDKPPMGANGPDFDRIIPELLTQYLPSWLMAVILLLILSASMSTLSSLVLVSASSVAIDLYKGHINPQISKENSLLMMRFLSAVFIVISYFVARYQLSFIIELMALSWGAVAGAFMAPFFFGLYWKKATHSGVVLGMITAIATNVILYYWLGAAKSPIAASIAMIVPFIVIPLVSFVTKPPKAEIIETAFAGVSGQTVPSTQSVKMP